MTQWRQDRIQSVIAGVDAVAWEMELKWGVGRLRLLVSTDLRERFDRQLRRWSESVWPVNGDQPDVDLVEQTGEATKRGWQALDQAAIDAGHKPLEPDVWETALPDGRVLAVVRSQAEAHKVAHERRGIVIYTLEEVARLAMANDLVSRIKSEFPTAEVVGVRDPTAMQMDWERGDELPI